MASLKYLDGPLDTALTGTVYPLQPNQVAPLTYQRPEWKKLGMYVLVAPSKKSVTQFSPYLRWVEAK